MPLIIRYGQRLANRDITAFRPQAAQNDLAAGTASDVPWNLTLVNSTHPLPEDYAIEFTVLSNGQKIDNRIYPDLQQMFDDARSQGVYPFVREGYRTREEQQEILEQKTKAYMNEGHLYFTAKKLAQKWVAAPGTSEHELGLAVDINADQEQSTSDEVYEWLAQNAWQYGFILRYPQGKENVTGIDYEPWHYRYVGKDVAEQIHEEGLTLEEYLANN
ncbi:MAG: M15 family metallopeptidase [Lachnospiraceae bacterium]|nr:M15 family metallopeptidase [Lachnospiraceae bacterium]